MTRSPQELKKRKRNGGFLRWLLKSLGILCVVLGFIGVFLPLLPTTPFLLLALLLFARSDPRWRVRILRHKLLGPYVAGYASNVGIPMRMKMITIGVLWATMLCSIFFFVHLAWVRWMLAGIAVAVTIHILMKKTRKV